MLLTKDFIKAAELWTVVFKEKKIGITIKILGNSKRIGNCIAKLHETSYKD